MNDILIKRENSPYIFSFPHSGEMLTSDMEWNLTPESQAFLPNVDWHLPELYKFLEDYKVNIISTPHSRYVVDVNRPPNADTIGNYRRSLVYDTNTWDESIYAIAPSKEEIERRIERYYKPYHDELEALITEKVRVFGKVYLVDMHSFMGPISEDVCLGNRHNLTSSEEFINRIYSAFDSEGFNCVKNKIFIGGYITQSYAIKDVVETLQIELRYTTYIEEYELDVRRKPSCNTTLFYETAFRLEEVFKKIGIEKKEKDALANLVDRGGIWYKRVIIGVFVLMVLLSISEDLKVVFKGLFS